jgi:hypothetical protein
MEAVAAASSIAGILSLTIQCLQLINGLETFCQRFNKKAVKAFLLDLKTSADVLGDVQELCEKIRNTEHNPVGGARMKLLYVHLADCASDLESWLDLTHGLEVSEKDRHRTVKELFGRFMLAIKNSAQMEVKDRFRYHQENIRIVARSRQVCIYVVEALLIAIYLPEEMRTFICTLNLPCCLRPPC